MSRLLWLCVGYTALGLGLVGVVLPLLPTTPFILLSVFAFARSSPRLHSWLITHRNFGPMIHNWNAYGAISQRAKLSAILVIVATFSVSLLLGAATVVLLIQLAVLSAVSVFILTRPSGPGA